MWFGGGTLLQICQPGSCNTSGQTIPSHSQSIFCVKRLPSCPPSIAARHPTGSTALCPWHRRWERAHGASPRLLTSGSATDLLSRSLHGSVYLRPLCFCDARSHSTVCVHASRARCDTAHNLPREWRQTTEAVLASGPPMMELLASLGSHALDAGGGHFDQILHWGVPAAAHISSQLRRSNHLQPSPARACKGCGLHHHNEPHMALHRTARVSAHRGGRQLYRRPRCAWLAEPEVRHSAPGGGTGANCCSCCGSPGRMGCLPAAPYNLWAGHRAGSRRLPHASTPGVFQMQLWRPSRPSCRLGA